MKYLLHPAGRRHIPWACSGCRQQPAPRRLGGSPSDGRSLPHREKNGQSPFPRSCPPENSGRRPSPRPAGARPGPQRTGRLGTARPKGQDANDGFFRNGAVDRQARHRRRVCDVGVKCLDALRRVFGRLELLKHPPRQIHGSLFFTAFQPSNLHKNLTPENSLIP